jgi:hypothetical protein
MNNISTRKARYLSDPLSVRLGGLAANLARVRSFSRDPANADAIFDLFEESKFFIEWTAADAEIGTAGQLADLQIQIAVWQRGWDSLWADEARRSEMAGSALDWSNRLIASSGLLDQ